MCVPGGGKSWHFHYYGFDKQKRMSLGIYSEVSQREARACETRPGRCLRRAFTRIWRASVNWRVAYDPPAIGHWLLVFLSRFFGCSPFKRLAMLNGPKVVTGGVAAWRLAAPSDGNALLWPEKLEHNGPSA